MHMILYIIDIYRYKDIKALTHFGCKHIMSLKPPFPNLSQSP